MFKSFHSTIFLLITLLLLVACNSPQDYTADLIIHNGNVWTADPDQPNAEAVAIRTDKILAVGSDSEIKRYQGSHTRMIDANHQSVLPGFIDNHTHFNRAGELLMGINLLDVNDEEQLRDRLSGAIERMPDPSAWITGGMWGAYAQWERDADGSVSVDDFTEWSPNRDMIDDISQETPVLLNKWDRTRYLANSYVIEEFGLTCSDTGVYCDNNRPNGLLSAEAARPILMQVPEPDMDHRIEEARLAMQRLSEHGVTTIHDITTPRQMQVFSKMKEMNELTVRVYARPTLDKWEQLADIGITHGFGDEWLKIGGLKGFVDGIMGNSSARFYEPYLTTGEHGSWRDMMYPPGNMKELITDADAAGLWPQVHAIGDQAIDSLITLFEHAIEENGPKERRFRMIHTQVLRDAAVADELARLDIIAEMQPYHAIDDMRWMEERIGERSRWAYAFRTLDEAGVLLSFGSDWPGTNASWYTSNPIHGVYAAVTRQTLEGSPEGGWFPEERIDLETALKAYTINNAYAEGTENIKGSITEGKLADIVVLNEDLFSVELNNLPYVEVTHTIIGGKLIFDGNNE